LRRGRGKRVSALFELGGIDLKSNAGGYYALKFIRGKYTGAEFPLRPNQPVIIGRSSELDVVLVDDLVSRKHAKLTLSDGNIFLEDLGSTNGTVVNGEKVQAAILKEGDRIVIGSSTLKLLRTTQEQAQTPELPPKVQLEQAEEANIPRVTEVNTEADASHLTEEHVPRLPEVSPPLITEKWMVGKLKLVALSDLLQLFHHSKRTGVLVVRGSREGRIYMRLGQVYHAAITEHPGISPRKSFARMVSWKEGDFELLGEDETPFSNEIEESIEALLMESMRQHDELSRLGGLPPLSSMLNIARPLVSPLRALSKELLDTFQLIYNHGVFQLVLDHSSDEDANCAQYVLELMRRGYVSLT